MSGIEDIDRGWDAILKHIAEVSRLEFRVGVVGSQADQPHPESGLTLGELAFIQEFGTDDGHVPPRRYIRSTVDRKQTAIADGMEIVVRDAISESASPKAAVQRLADRVAAMVKDTILSSDGILPNATATIIRKQSAHPLLDSQAMYDAVSGEVRTAGTAEREGTSILSVEGGSE